MVNNTEHPFALIPYFSSVYPISDNTSRAISWKLTHPSAVISPPITTNPVVANVSQATLALGSCF